MTGGILQPLKSYRFRVLFKHNINGGLTEQIKKVDLDLVKKRLYIEIRQPITADVFQSVINAINCNSQTIIIETMSSDNIAMWSIDFNDCKCIKHESSFDYAVSDVFYHKLTFSFWLANTSASVAISNSTT